METNYITNGIIIKNTDGTEETIHIPYNLNNIFVTDKDIIGILNVGYQVIIQKVPPKFNAKKTIQTIISGFSDLLNKFCSQYYAHYTSFGVNKPSHMGNKNDFLKYCPEAIIL
jgi:hypothetical protein